MRIEDLKAAYVSGHLPIEQFERMVGEAVAREERRRGRSSAPSLVDADVILKGMYGSAAHAERRATPEGGGA